MSHELRVERLLEAEQIVRKYLEFGRLPFWQARDEIAAELGVMKLTASDYVDFLKHWMPNNGYDFVPGSPTAFADALKAKALSNVTILRVKSGP